MEHTQPEQGGLRESKRRDTLQRVAQAGLELFLARGYEATTVEDISAAAGISRRTFFHYFKSKDEVLLAWQTGLVESLRQAVLQEENRQAPLDALCGALLKLAADYDSDTTIAIAQLLRSNDQLRAANQVKFLQLEQAAFEALCHLWPQRRRRGRLRMVAMIGLGAFRVAIDEWTEEGGTQPFSQRIGQAFAVLRAELQAASAAAPSP
jgi:AcrR family transcriptional regulator